MRRRNQNSHVRLGLLIIVALTMLLAGGAMFAFSPSPPSPGCTTHYSDDVHVPVQYLNTITTSQCWEGGNYVGTNDPNTTPWETYHHSGCFTLKAPNVTVRWTGCTNFGDGYRVSDLGSNWHFDAVLGVKLHDDCVENDHGNSGSFTRSGCLTYVGYSDKGDDHDASAQSVTIDHNWMELVPTPTVYKGTAPGNGGWFKLDSNATKLVVTNNVFVAHRLPNHQDLKPPPPSKLTKCTGNVVAWDGPVAFPAADKVAWVAQCPDTKFIGL